MADIDMHSFVLKSSHPAGQASGDMAALFPYWSFTKTVIALCALKLVEQGDLDLDMHPDGQPYTLRQLLAHTAGVADYGGLADYQRDVAAGVAPWSRQKLLDRVMANGMLYEPAKGWAYSNVGYMLAVEILEQVSGKDLATLVAELVAVPLGLNSIELAQEPADFTRLYWPDATKYHPKWVYHGCLIGTVPDAARLLHAVFQSDFLRPDLVAQMLEHHPLGGAITGRPWVKHGYSLGLMAGEVTGGVRDMGHSGCGWFSVNAVYHFPELADPVTVACFTGGVDEGVAEHEVVRLALAG